MRRRDHRIIPETHERRARKPGPADISGIDGAGDAAMPGNTPEAKQRSGSSRPRIRHRRSRSGGRSRSDGLNRRPVRSMPSRYGPTGCVVSPISIRAAGRCPNLGASSRQRRSSPPGCDGNVADRCVGGVENKSDAARHRRIWNRSGAFSVEFEPFDPQIGPGRNFQHDLSLAAP